MLKSSGYVNPLRRTYYPTPIQLHEVIYEKKNPIVI